MMKMLALFVVTALAAATPFTAPAAGARVQSPQDLAQLLRTPPGDFVGEVVSTSTGDGVTVEELGSHEGTHVEAFVVRPAQLPQAPRTCGAMLFVHWFAPPEPTSNKTQFLDEAKAWARRGVVSILPAAFWADPERYKRRQWQTDFQNSVDQARQLRQYLSLLRLQPCVDPKRIAIVGHDYGAMFGSLVAAIEPDIKAVVLIAGVPKFHSWYEFGSSTGVPTGDNLATYRAELARIDPGFAVSLIKAPILFQFGTKDRYTPKEQIDAFTTSATGPKEVKLYDSGHDMTLADIRRDRTEWLSKQLSVQ